MTDIFLSYASVDLKRARKLAKALEARGWSVWWDRKLPPGMNFSREILKQRSAARCVVVLWTKNSIESEWVEEEAHRAKKRECLVPVLLDDVEIPFGFGTRQAAGLIDWEGQQQHEGFEALVGAVTRHLGGARTDLTNPEPETEVSPDLSDSAQAPKPPPAVATVQLSPDARELTELQAIEMVAAQPQPRPKPEHQRSAPPQRASSVWTRLKASFVAASPVLRSKPTDLSERQARAMLTKRGFFDTGVNDKGDFANDLVDNGDGTLTDRATGLMWQQAGSDDEMDFRSVQDYVVGLNRDGFAGYTDWRLPTLEEGASLLEPEERNGGLYIDPLFDSSQRRIWTSDTGGSGAVWVVGFRHGFVYRPGLGYAHFVRVCRAAGQ